MVKKFVRDACPTATVATTTLTATHPPHMQAWKFHHGPREWARLSDHSPREIALHVESNGHENVQKVLKICQPTHKGHHSQAEEGDPPQSADIEPEPVRPEEVRVDPRVQSETNG